MKTNIKKLQQGGMLAFTPIINAPTQQTPTQQSSTSQVEESSGLLDEDLYKQLVSKGGLVNDVNQFTQELNSMDSDPYAYLNPNHVKSKLQIVAKVNELRRNNELWTKSMETAKSNGGLSEVAVGTSGEVFARGVDGRITQVDASTIAESPDEYKALTVSELLNARQYDQQLAFDQSIFRIAENSIGLEEIVSQIEGVVQGLGSIDNSSEFFRSKDNVVSGFATANGIKKPTASQAAGIAEIAKLKNAIGDGSEGVYKFKQTLKSQRGNVGEAMSYI